MEKKLPVVGISQGDINGIGYEVPQRSEHIIEKPLILIIWALISLKIQERLSLVKSM